MVSVSSTCMRSFDYRNWTLTCTLQLTLTSNLPAQAQQATTFKLQQATNQPDEDLGTFTQNLLQQMREHMDSASRKMTARMAAAEKAAESLERELLALMEQAQQDAKL
ncbi:hypothetical protein ACK3TF_002546 [Chlorella vulgaris]